MNDVRNAAAAIEYGRFAATGTIIFSNQAP
jgi:Flp pilus assembly pilin Flp